jgi:bifunctional DNA-binding transcriptional regulator/antitoxin component of YhaV-PrlF toxin-antitoxin module
MAKKQIFNALLEKAEGSEATGIEIPFDVEKEFGGKRVRVKLSINGKEHHSTIVRMGARYVVIIPKHFRDVAKINAGDYVDVTLVRDTDERVVEIPKDLALALRKAHLQNVFSKMSFTHQNEYVNSVVEAKKEETRLKRIKRTIEMVSAHKK